MSKSDDIRRLRELQVEQRKRAIELPAGQGEQLLKAIAKVVKPVKAKIRGKRVALGPRAIEGLNQAVEHAQGKRELKTTEVVVKRGRPAKHTPEEYKAIRAERARKKRAEGRA